MTVDGKQDEVIAELADYYSVDSGDEVMNPEEQWMKLWIMKNKLLNVLSLGLSFKFDTNNFRTKYVKFLVFQML